MLWTQFSIPLEISPKTALGSLKGVTSLIAKVFTLTVVVIIIVFVYTDPANVYHSNLIVFWYRIYQGCDPHGDRFCCDGICWVFRQVDIHSNQQHHRWCFLTGNFPSKFH